MPGSGEPMLVSGASLTYLGPLVVNGDLHIKIGVFLCKETLECFLNRQGEYYSIY